MLLRWFISGTRTLGICAIPCSVMFCLAIHPDGLAEHRDRYCWHHSKLWIRTIVSIYYYHGLCYYRYYVYKPVVYYTLPIKKNTFFPGDLTHFQTIPGVGGVLQGGFLPYELRIYKWRN